jgi:hypothetical protein
MGTRGSLQLQIREMKAAVIVTQYDSLLIASCALTVPCNIREIRGKPRPAKSVEVPYYDYAGIHDCRLFLRYWSAIERVVLGNGREYGPIVNRSEDRLPFCAAADKQGGSMWMNHLEDY